MEHDIDTWNTIFVKGTNLPIPNMLMFQPDAWDVVTIGNWKEMFHAGKCYKY